MKDRKIPSVRQDTFYLDLLRVAAAFAVVMIHVSTRAIYAGTVPFGSFQWCIRYLFDAINKWCVPVFIMISGSLLLNPAHGIKKVLTKNLPRILIAYFFWSAFYALPGLLRGEYGLDILSYRILGGYYHLWFLPMLAGLYLTIPLLQKIVESKPVMIYFLIITFVYAIAYNGNIYEINRLCEPVGYYIRSAFSVLDYPFISEYAFYMVWGYFLHTVKPTKTGRRLIYLGGVLGLIVSVSLGLYFSLLRNQFEEERLNYNTISIMLESSAVFLFAKEHSDKLFRIERFRRVITWISGASFGIYLCHPFLQEKIIAPHLSGFLLSAPFTEMLCEAVLVFTFALLLSTVIRHIPILNRYIV